MQYYWAAFEFLKQGAVSRLYVQRLIEAVDKRRRTLWTLFSSALRYMLESRLLRLVRISLAEGTESVRSHLKRSIDTAAEWTTSLDELVSTLTSEGADARCWDQFLNHAAGASVPTNTQELGRLMHVSNALKPALNSVKQGEECRAPLAPSRPRLLLQIDDIVEWKVFDRAKNILKSYQADLYNDTKVQMVGLFRTQKVFVDGKGRSSLWTNCPGLSSRSVTGDRLQCAEDIFSTVYGSAISSLVSRWLEEKDGDWHN